MDSALRGYPLELTATTTSANTFLAAGAAPRSPSVAGTHVAAGSAPLQLIKVDLLPASARRQRISTLAQPACGYPNASRHIAVSLQEKEEK